jgi:hypothetical protein
MTFPHDPHERSPKGDHNRRLSLGLDADEFAATAGITVDDLKHYEFADMDEISDPTIAQKVGRALERLEANTEPKVDNGPIPSDDDDVPARVYAALQSTELGRQLALADPESAAQVISSELAAIDPAIRLLGVGERARGPMRELLVEWSETAEGVPHQEVIVLPMQS